MRLWTRLAFQPLRAYVSRFIGFCAVSRIIDSLSVSKLESFPVAYKCFINNKETSIFNAAMEYADKNIPLIVIAGREYGTGSSRDWAAKGTRLLGVKAGIAESFERIHRSNLIGMGVLPLEFINDQNPVLAIASTC